MEITELFNNVNESEEKLWNVLDKIFKHSVDFQTMLDDDDIKLEIAYYSYKTGYVDFNLLYNVFNNNFNMKKNDIIKIIISLSQVIA